MFLSVRLWQTRNISFQMDHFKSTFKQFRLSDIPFSLVRQLLIKLNPWFWEHFETLFNRHKLNEH